MTHEDALVQPLTSFKEATAIRNTQPMAIINVKPRLRLKQLPKRPLKQEAILGTGRTREQARD